MTAEDWKYVEQQLSGVFGLVKFKIDEYEVTVIREHIKNRLINMVYVKGEFHGKWLNEDCEERRRFLACRSRNYYDRKTQRIYAKTFGKRSEQYKSITKKQIYFEPWWNSVRSMKSHFIKNNKSIELVRS